MTREFFVHHAGICESENVGSGTRIWAFAHVLANAVIGMDCNICDHVFVENDVSVGNRVTVKCGVQLWDGLILEDDVFVGPNVTFSNDLYPRSKQHPNEYLKTRIQKGASIGANATVLPGIVIGTNAMVGAGAVVTKSIPANAIAVGNPAKIVGYVDAGNALGNSVELHEESGPAPVAASVKKTAVNGVTIHLLPAVTDIRGRLSVGEFEKDIPFKPSRYFTVFDVPTAETRGAHAHVSCHQFLIAVHGTLHVVVDDGQFREEVVLNKANMGLYLPPMTWGTQYRYSQDAVLLVFASDPYNADDYIRDYEEFSNRVRGEQVQNAESAN